MFVTRLTVIRTGVGVCCLAAVWLLVACAPLIHDPHTAMLVPRSATVASIPAPPVAPVAASDPQVVINNFTFTPATITVTVGTTVAWSNQDDTPHTVTEANKLFGSKGLDTGDQFAYRFTAAGVYTYFCSIHSVMIGHVIVK